MSMCEMMMAGLMPCIIPATFFLFERTFLLLFTPAYFPSADRLRVSQVVRTLSTDQHGAWP
jgi:hypothetical protein